MTLRGTQRSLRKAAEAAESRTALPSHEQRTALRALHALESKLALVAKSVRLRPSFSSGTAAPVPAYL